MLRISPVQSKMARVALGWGVRDLARIAKVSTDTISRLERGEELKERTLADIRAVLETAGIEFLPDNGVRLRSTPVAAKAGRGGPGGARKPRSTGKSTVRRARKPSQPKAAPLVSKEAQIRALREQGAR